MRGLTRVSSVDAILEEISELTLEDQEMVDQIVHKRIIEGKREEILADYKAAMEEHRQGRTKSGSAGDLFSGLG